MCTPTWFGANSYKFVLYLYYKYIHKLTETDTFLSVTQYKLIFMANINVNVADRKLIKIIKLMILNNFVTLKHKKLIYKR